MLRNLLLEVAAGSETTSENTLPNNDCVSVSTPLDYLRRKESLVTFDPQEELIFFPELYGICPTRSKKHSCLNLKLDPELRKRVEAYVKRTTLPNKRVPILKYIHEYKFVEIYLNNLNLKKDVPEQIFLCRNLRVLSLKGNQLKTISPSIGRLKKLEALHLTDNQLATQSIPYTITFCSNLRSLYLDSNQMMALPGFLLEMKNLQTIRRLSAKYSLREIWISTKFIRVVEIEPTKLKNKNLVRYQVPSLQQLAAGKIITAKVDHFSISGLSPVHENVISKYYGKYFICENCDNPRDKESKCTYEVNTYRYGHLGNYWTTFVHQACSKSCAKKLDQHSSRIEKRTEVEATNKYYDYIKTFEEPPLLLRTSNELHHTAANTPNANHSCCAIS